MHPYTSEKIANNLAMILYIVTTTGGYEYTHAFMLIGIHQGVYWGGNLQEIRKKIMDGEILKHHSKFRGEACI